MPPVGFEPTIPVSEQLQTYTSDGAATGTGIENILFEQNGIKLWNKWHFVENTTVIMQHALHRQ